MTAMVTSAIARTWVVRLAASRFTLSVRPFQVPATPGTCAWPPSLPSVPTSRATRVTSEANALSWSSIVLTVSLTCRISPRTSTVILRDRSPRATAVVTSAMLRTCVVRLVAIALTESVRSFHVPATPGTIPWPPSLPSVPTSRATLVTSAAKPFSWSTMVLMVFFSSRISPFTSTVILRDRSPRATAVVTSAMFRTWPVRFDAIQFTLSVRSFQVPATPGTCAWPPSLPSVPTSRATRVTSAAKPFSWSTIVLMVFFSSRISPFTSTAILRERSPFATAVVTSAMFRTWPVRFVAIALTESVRSFQVPATPGTCAWPPSLPSVPTSRATRVTSAAKPFSWSTIVLTVSFTCRISPRTSTVIFRDRSPRATAVVTSAMLRTCEVRFVAMALTESVRSFQVPATPGTIACPPSLPSVPTSRATRVTSEANDRSWSTMVLMASLSCRISPRTSTVILRDRSPFATAIVTSEMLRTWAVRFDAIELTLSVRSFQTPLTPLTCAWPPSLPSVPTSRATRVTSEVNPLICSIIVLTIVAERRNSPSSGRPSTSSRIVCDRSPLATAAIERVTSAVGHSRSSRSVLTETSIAAPCAALPVAAHALPRLALLADRLADSLELGGEPLVGGDDVVERVGDLAADAAPVGREPRREVAVAYRAQRAEDLPEIDRLIAGRRTRARDDVPVLDGLHAVSPRAPRSRLIPHDDRRSALRRGSGAGSGRTATAVPRVAGPQEVRHAVLLLARRRPRFRRRIYRREVILTAFPRVPGRLAT